MRTQTNSAIEYATAGPITDFGNDPKIRDALDGVPASITAVAPIVQGLVVHEFWRSHYGLPETEPPITDVERRRVGEIAGRILELDGRPFVEAREPNARFVGNCRTFSTLTCALLRRHGIAARARCGFGTYFEQNRFVDHWIVEWWNRDADRWVQSDVQLDEVQCAALGVSFDPLDLPVGAFVSGGDGWRMCRNYEAEPQHFGILDFWGLWFVRDNTVRDLAALNKMELLPWDGWGIMLAGREVDASVCSLIDEVAAATANGPATLIRSLYDRETLRVPSTVTSLRAGSRVHIGER